MKERCRVTEELNAYMRQIDKEERRQAQIDTNADKIMDEITGQTREPYWSATDWADTLTDAECRDVLCEYMARKFATIERGITDDRQIQADEYLLAQIKEWALEQAEKELDE